MGAGPVPADPLGAAGNPLHLEEHGPAGHRRPAGGGPTPAVLLLHGFPQHGYEWRKVVPLLAGDHRVLVLDNRSSGRSAVAGGEGPASFVADAVAVLDALGIDRVILGGHDWGGYTALLLALEHPERVVRVVATGSPHPWPRASLRAARELGKAWYTVALASPLGPRLVADGTLVRYMLRARGAGRLFGPEDEEAYLAPLRDPGRAAAASRLYRSYLRASLDILVGRAFAERRLSVPARLLFGTEDAFIPLAYVDGAEGPEHGLTVELLAGVSHWIPEECPELVAARLRG